MQNRYVLANKLFKQMRLYESVKIASYFQRQRKKKWNSLGREK